MQKSVQKANGICLHTINWSFIDYLCWNRICYSSQLSNVFHWQNLHCCHELGFLHQNSKLHFWYAWNRGNYIKVLSEKNLKCTWTLDNIKSEINSIKRSNVCQKVKQPFGIRLDVKSKDKTNLLNFPIDYFQKLCSEPW